MNLIEEKILNSIIFFASKSTRGKINRLKLMKILWLADRIHLNKYGRLILRDNYNALPHGPVPSTTMDATKLPIDNYFDVQGFNIIAKSEFVSNFFSKSDIEVMEHVWEQYGEMDQFQLKDFSHNFPEWLRYEKELNDTSLPNSYPIIIDDFFNAPKNQVKYVHNNEHSKKSEIVYHTHNSIQSYLSK